MTLLLSNSNIELKMTLLLSERSMMKRTIKGLRNDLGLTQKQMAEKLGVPIASYQRYENYQQRIPVDVIFDIAKLCDISNPIDIKIQN